MVLVLAVLAEGQCATDPPWFVGAALFAAMIGPPALAVWLCDAKGRCGDD